MLNRLTVTVTLLSLVLLGAHCNGPDPDPDPDPGPDPPPDPANCTNACELMADADCPQAEPTAEGGTCVAVCENVETSGAVSLNPGCVVELFAQDPLPADICDQVEACVVFGEL